MLTRLSISTAQAGAAAARSEAHMTPLMRINFIPEYVSLIALGRIVAGTPKPAWRICQNPYVNLPQYGVGSINDGVAVLRDKWGVEFSMELAMGMQQACVTVVDDDAMV